jgi:hypothetical protein
MHAGILFPGVDDIDAGEWNLTPNFLEPRVNRAIGVKTSSKH